MTDFKLDAAEALTVWVSKNPFTLPREFMKILTPYIKEATENITALQNNVDILRHCILSNWYNPVIQTCIYCDIRGPKGTFIHKEYCITEKIKRGEL